MKSACCVFLLVAGCASAPSDSPIVSTNASGTAVNPTSTGTPEAHGAPDFEVHEWGLLDVDGVTAQVRTVDLPAVERRPVVVKKPVLYFHLGPGTARVVVDVKVTVPPEDGGAIVEHFPAGVVNEPGWSVQWSGLHIKKSACATATPSKEAGACNTPDGICEALELTNYVTSDASCIEAGDINVNHLFYRAREKTPALPFEVSEIEGGKLKITHAKASDVIGPIVYVHDEPGRGAVSVLAPPALGASITADPPTTSDATSAARAIDAAMHEANLSDDEIAAFNRAWRGSLYGEDAAAKKQPPPAKAALAPKDYLLFVVPMSLADGVSRISITPAPRAIRRFLLVRLSV
jgi:hypothetical protein